MIKYRKIGFLISLFLIYIPLPVLADSILNDLAPSVFGARDRGPKPEDTLIAPFADDKIPSKNDQKNLITETNNASISLTVPHQDRTFMTQWAATQASSVFTYNPYNIANDSTDGPTAQTALFKKSFSSPAQADIQALFALPYFANRLNDQKMQIKAFVDTPATIQNEGVFGNVYRWLIDVPVTITFYPSGYINDQITRSNKFETKTMTVRVQIARISGEYPDGCVIERFTTSTPLP